MASESPGESVVQREPVASEPIVPREHVEHFVLNEWGSTDSD